MTFAALFPGQGSHVVGMAAALHAESSAARGVLEAAESALPGLLKLMFEGPIETLTLTAHQQPALVAAGAAAFAAWREAGGPMPSVAAGHSLGEFTAHVAAGSLSIADAIQLVHARGTYMQDAVAPGVGAMAALLKLDDEVVHTLCRDAAAATGEIVEIANLNAPGQVVVSGSAAAVEEASKRAKERGGRAIPLKVSAPFHCSLMQPAADRLAVDLATIPFKPGAFDVICNVDAAPLPEISAIVDRLVRQVTAPVQWTRTLQTLAERGVDRWVEFGSGTVLSGLAKRTLGTIDVVSVDAPDTLEAALRGP